MSEMRRLKKGDVLKYSWGYDQTNIDAFEIVRESPKSVWLQAIDTEPVPGSGGFMSQRVRPVPGSAKGKTFIKRRQANWRGDEEILSMDFGVATLWAEGAEPTESWYA